MPGAAVPVLGAAKTLRRIPAVCLRRGRGYGAEQHDRGQGAQKRFHDVTFGVAKLCVDNAPGSLRVPLFVGLAVTPLGNSAVFVAMRCLLVRIRTLQADDNRWPA